MQITFLGKHVCAICTLSGNIFVQFCKQFAHEYPTLLPRVWKTLVSAVENTSKPPEALFGGIVGLSNMGKQVTQSLLLPLVPAVLERISREEGVAGEDEEGRREAHQQCRRALIQAAGSFLQAGKEGAGEEELRMPSGFQIEKVAMNELADAFGEQILPYAMADIPMGVQGTTRRSRRFAR